MASVARAAIFDWGGVLMRTLDYRPRRAWDRRLSLEPGSVEAVVHGSEAWEQAQRGAITTEAYWRAVGEALHLAARDLDRLKRDFYRGDRLNGSLVTLIRALRKARIRIGLLSNNTLDILDRLADSGIADLFDAQAISAEIGSLKPAREAYHAILARLDVAAENSLFIDDSPPNVAAAQAVGMQAILFSPDLDLSRLFGHWMSTGSLLISE